MIGENVDTVAEVKTDIKVCFTNTVKITEKFYSEIFAVVFLENYEEISELV